MAVLDRVFISVPADDEPWHHLSRLLARAGSRLRQDYGINVSLEDMPPATIGLICRFTAASADEIKGEEINHCRFWLGETLTEFILIHWEASLVRRLVMASNPQLSKRQQAALCRAVLRRLASDQPWSEGLAAMEEPPPLSESSAGPRRQFVSHRLLEYLTDHDSIHLQGFVSFRLRPYIEIVKETVEQVNSDYGWERSYAELVQLLKSFVQGQAARIGLVHVYTQGNGRFALTDEDGLTLDDKTLAAMVTGAGSNPVHYGDLLLSALVSLAPRQVLLHKPGAATPLLQETLRAIKQVFSDRVFTCQGCKTCRERPF